MFQSGLMYWPFVQVSCQLLGTLISWLPLTWTLAHSSFLLQLTNFGLVPVHWRTAYTGLCGFLWATFLCFSQQSGDGTFESAFAFLHVQEARALERPPEK